MWKSQGPRACRTVLLLCGLAVAAPLYADAGNEIKLTASQAQAMGVETAPLGSPGAAAGKSLPARVTIPDNQLQIVSAPVAGLVETIAAAPGQAVKKGQLLARLQSPGLVEIQRGLLQATTQAQLARETLKRDGKLFEEGIIAESRYRAAKGHDAEAAAALSERRQALRLAGMSEAAIRNLEKNYSLSGTMDIPAPISGVVLERMAVAGQRVEAATPLYKVAQLAPLWLEIQVPVAAIGGLQAGAEVSVPAYRATGKVLQLGRAVEEGSQTVTIRAEVGQGAENLRPGQLVEAVVAGGNGKSWRVPDTALIRARDQAYVFVQIPSGFLVQPVRVMGETAAGSTIGGDLRDGQRIAVRGTVSLKAVWQGLAAGGE